MKKILLVIFGLGFALVFTTYEPRDKKTEKPHKTAEKEKIHCRRW